MDTVYDEVWCSKLDQNTVSDKFKSTLVVPKIFVPKGRAILIKRENVKTVSGIQLADKNGIIGIVEL